MRLPTLLLAIFAATAISTRAEVSPIRITVEQIAKSEAKVDPKTKAAPTHEKTQVRSLKIQLDNNSAQAFDGLSVKYWFIGHPMTERAAKPIVEGERKASLTPRGREVVESELVSKHYVEEHYEVQKGGKGGKPTKVPASGEKIIGYAVRVLKDGKMLSEFYSDPAYKALIKDGDQPAAPVAPAAAKPGAKPAAK